MCCFCFEAESRLPPSPLGFFVQGVGVGSFDVNVHGSGGSMGWRFDVGFCVLVRFAALMGVVVFVGRGVCTKRDN
jgi:hypothetical protein